MSTALLLDPVYKQHQTGPGHPERPERYDAVRSGLEREALVRDAVRMRRGAHPKTRSRCAMRGIILL